MMITSNWEVDPEGCYCENIEDGHTTDLEEEEDPGVDQEVMEQDENVSTIDGEDNTEDDEGTSDDDQEENSDYSLCKTMGCLLP